MAASDNPNWDPYISWGQRQDLYHKTGDRYWLEGENITKEMAGKQYALIRGKKKKMSEEYGNSPLPADDPRTVARAEESMRQMGFQHFGGLSSKDKSAVLQDENVKCSNEMLLLRDRLKVDIGDEIQANAEYKDISSMMQNLKLPIWNSAIDHIANDEAEHREILEIIVDVITEKCDKVKTPGTNPDKAMGQMQLIFPPRGGRING
jgi:hypothetical protein